MISCEPARRNNGCGALNLQDYSEHPSYFSSDGGTAVWSVASIQSVEALLEETWVGKYLLVWEGSGLTPSQSSGLHENKEEIQV